MRLNHSDKVLGFTGEEIPTMDGPESAERPLTFLDFVMSVLNYTDPPPPHGEPLGAEVKARIFGLMSKFFNGKKEVDLTVEELALMKKRAALALSPFAYGRICEWLEGHEQITAKKDDEDGAKGVDQDPDPEGVQK